MRAMLSAHTGQSCTICGPISATVMTDLVLCPYTCSRADRRIQKLTVACRSLPHCPVFVQLIKFSGCYHGHADSFLVQAGSGVLTLGLPDSPGVPKSSTGAGTLLLPFLSLQHHDRVTYGTELDAGCHC
jgi:hypothetical protein